MRESDRLAAYRTSLIDGAVDHGVQLALDASRDWADVAFEEIERLAERGVIFTADDLVLAVGAPDNPKVIGAVFRTASRRGLIEAVGFERSRRIQRHGGWSMRWTGTRSEWPDAQA